MSDIKKGNNILAIGAHPDDIEYGCGGTIVKHLELGDRVFALILTKGEKGGHPEDEEECLNSLKTLGIDESDIFFGDFPDSSLPNDFNVVKFIENCIIKNNINKVYTHYPEDRHQDHRNCSKSVSSAARKVSELLLYQGPSTSDPFEPHYFVEISPVHLDKKIKSLGYYQSQIKKGIINLETVRGFALVNGNKGNVKYAEAFALNHVTKEGEDV